MTWEVRKKYLNSGKINCLMSYRSQSLIDINKTHFSSGVSEAPRWFMATVERGGSREIDQPTMPLTFWQSVLVKATPCPPQFLCTVFPMFLLWVLVQPVGACAYQARWILSPWGCKTKSQNWRIWIQMWKNKRIDWYLNCNYSEIHPEQKDCCFKMQSQFYL